MTKPAQHSATILIVTDITTDAALVKGQLGHEFQHVVISTVPDKMTDDFLHHWPSVLVLAFNTLEKSESYYLGLYRQCHELHQHHHRTIILCNKEEMRHAYELCKKDYFDDHILFWPMTHDTLRLPMAVHHALHEMTAIGTASPQAAEFAAQSRHLAKQERILSKQIERGDLHIRAVSHAMEESGQQIGAAIDGLPRRLISRLRNEDDTTDSDGKIINEVERFKHDEIQPRLLATAGSVQPLERWAHNLEQGYAPVKESVRALDAMAGRAQPVILVIDDDVFQQKIMARLLEGNSYRPIFAADGFDALHILSELHPHLILMDVMMPNMDRLETTRRIKALSQFADTPIIMLTGESKCGIVRDSLKAGATDFVVKPFDRATLLAKISKALKMSHAGHDSAEPDEPESPGWIFRL